MVFGEDYRFAQLIIGALVASVLLCVLCATRPYQLESDNILAVACQAAIVVTLQLAVYLRLVQLEIYRQQDDARLRRDEALVAELAAELGRIEDAVGAFLISLGAVPVHPNLNPNLNPNL